MNKVLLKNGLKVIFYPMPNTHSIAIGLYIRAGAKYESSQENGITHFLEHIHFRELEKMSQEELYYNMESIGSTLRASTYCDLLRFNMKIRPVYLCKCIDIFKNIMCTYNWTENSFKQEKAVVINQINEQNSCLTIEPIVRKSIFGNSSLAYNIMGSNETINHIDSSKLVSYKKTVFNKNNMALCVTGCINEHNIQLIKDEFETIQINDGTRNETINICPMLFHRKPNIVFENVKWDYLDVNISFDINYDNITIDELNILNCILGEGVGSRLQKHIREELGYTSDIYSETEIYENFAILNIRFTVYKKLFIECVSKVLDTVNKLKYDINFKDLDVSLPFYTENLLFNEDDTEQMNFTLAYNSLVLEKEISVTPLLNNRSTINRLMEIAKSIFTTNNTSIVVLGNCNRVTKKSIFELISKLDI